MSTDPKATPAPPARHKGMKIFTYPKIIFIWPTFLVAIVCYVGMLFNRDVTTDPTKPAPGATASSDPAAKPATAKDAAGNDVKTRDIKRFSSAQNIFGVLFLTVFFFNILIMAVDFPRFTIIAIILLAAAVTFFLLWLNVWFNLVQPLVDLMESVFAVANAGFYLMIAIALGINFGVIWLARYLDYWEILPNEILHNHGPFSDLERFPTMNLKFDKEIPDILEYALLRSGRLVLHVQNERRAIVLDNVLWIDHKEDQLKRMMSRMEVRVTTDQEAASEPT